MFEMCHLDDDEIVNFVKRCLPVNLKNKASIESIVLFLRRYESAMSIKFSNSVKEVTNNV